MSSYPDISRAQDTAIVRRMTLCGAVDFDRDKLSAANHRHVEGVRACFKERPNDLLKMGISAGDARVAFSFVVDDDPRFAYEGWHLARSLVTQCGGDPAAIHVQCTPGVSEGTRDLFRAQGYHVHDIERFGDGRHCNKIAQFEALRQFDFDIAVLLDTDMIAVADIRPFLGPYVSGKVVDAPNPPVEMLRNVASVAGLAPPGARSSDGGLGETLHGNCNGGFYAVPKAQCDQLERSWRRWALWLLQDIELLRGYEAHVHQVSFWLALQDSGVPFEAAPANLNYYVHFAGEHRELDRARPIALLHYHKESMDVFGRLAPAAALPPEAEAAISLANEQIGAGFNNHVFWNYRYRHWPERGSGVGSRGDYLIQKRALLRDAGIEHASSVLDVGCGDIEVIRELSIGNYVGLDQSLEAIEHARSIRPDWEFRLGLDHTAAAADMVLCLEVLIHQNTREAYLEVIDFLAAKTIGSLIVSGYACGTEAIERNPRVFFHEPLEESLRRTGRFSRIELVVQRPNVVILRADT